MSGALPLPGLTQFPNCVDQCCGGGTGCANATESFNFTDDNINGHLSGRWEWNTESGNPMSVPFGTLAADGVSVSSITPLDGARPEGEITVVTGDPHTGVAWVNPLNSGEFIAVVVDEGSGEWTVESTAESPVTPFPVLIAGAGDIVSLAVYDDGMAAVAIGGTIVWIGTTGIPPGTDLVASVSWSDAGAGAVASQVTLLCTPTARACPDEAIQDEYGLPLLDSNGECILGSEPLTEFFAALANSSDEPVEIVLLADSVGEGYNATAIEDTYARLLAEEYAAAYNAGPHGPGWLPVEANTDPPGPYLSWTTPNGTGPTSPAPEDATGGLGGWSRTFVDADPAAENTGDFDSVIVQYTKEVGELHLAGLVDLDLNSGLPDPDSGYRYVSPNLGPTPNTLSVTGEDFAQLDGAFFCQGGNDQAGVRFYIASHSTFGLFDYDAHHATWQSMEKRPPDLLLVCCGIADVLLDSVTPAVWQTRLEAVFEHARDLMGETGSIAYGFEWETAGMPVDNRWALDIRFRAIESCNAYGVLMIDLYGAIGDLFPNGVLSPYAAPDGIHLNDAGHALVKTTIGEKLQLI